MSDEFLDVRRLPYMPLVIETLRKSKTWLRCRRRPELGFYVLNLWMRAWHEVPAGSIEDDDDVLADAAMCAPEAWTGLKEILLEGWERRDGRVYHRTVTELATEAATKLRGNKKRTEEARKAAEERRRATATTDVTDPVTETVTELVTEAATEDVTAPVTEHEGKGREGKRNTDAFTDVKPSARRRPKAAHPKPPSPAVAAAEPQPQAVAEWHGSAEEQFWAMLPEWETSTGVKRGQLMQIQKFSQCGFDDLIAIAKSAANAKDVRRYLGKIASDARRDSAPPPPPDPKTPAWVSGARADGYPVDREGKYWRFAGGLFDDDKQQVGN